MRGIGTDKSCSLFCIVLVQLTVIKAKIVVSGRHFE